MNPPSKKMNKKVKYAIIAGSVLIFGILGTLAFYAGGSNKFSINEDDLTTVKEGNYSFEVSGNYQRLTDVDGDFYGYTDYLEEGSDLDLTKASFKADPKSGILITTREQLTAPSTNLSAGTTMRQELIKNIKNDLPGALLTRYGCESPLQELNIQEVEVSGADLSVRLEFVCNVSQESLNNGFKSRRIIYQLMYKNNQDLLTSYALSIEVFPVNVSDTVYRLANSIAIED